MTMHPFSRRSARPSALRAALLPAHGTACVLLAAWLLTACGSTPLPPWPATPTAPRSAEQPAASRPQARPAPTGPAAVSRPLPDHAPLVVQGAGPMAAPAVLPSAPPA
ncbi:peptidase M14, partial [Verminephrobacter sp. Larva24]